MAPSPAAPLETLIKYLPALLPADKKSVTLLIKPLVELTEINIPLNTITIINQSIKNKFIKALFGYSTQPSSPWSLISDCKEVIIFLRSLKPPMVNHTKTIPDNTKWI